jgi:hypothetical protein
VREAKRITRTLMWHATPGRAQQAAMEKFASNVPLASLSGKDDDEIWCASCVFHPLSTVLTWHGAQGCDRAAGGAR